jgi:hypothetical protein
MVYCEKASTLLETLSLDASYTKLIRWSNSASPLFTWSISSSSRTAIKLSSSYSLAANYSAGAGSPILLIVIFQAAGIFISSTLMWSKKQVVYIIPLASEMKLMSTASVGHIPLNTSRTS